MDELTALTILANTIETCLNNDLTASEIFAALNFLATRVQQNGRSWNFVKAWKAVMKTFVDKY
jgi:hypothetical protein